MQNTLDQYEIVVDEYRMIKELVVTHCGHSLIELNELQNGVNRADAIFSVIQLVLNENLGLKDNLSNSYRAAQAAQSDYDTAIDSLNQKIQELNNEMKQLIIDLEMTRGLIDAYRTSRSWQLTSPLRSLGNYIRKEFGK